MLPQALDRRCAYSFMEFAISTDEALQFERAWASSRPGVVQRHVATEVKFNDAPDSWEYLLTSEERGRLEDYTKKYPGHVWDLNQAEKRKLMSSLDGPLHTLMRGMGIIWAPPLGRWFTPREVATAMGYGVETDMANEAGSVCLFTRGQATAYNRPHRSMTNQIGNAMHVNSAGGVFFTIAVMMPKVSQAYG